MPVVPVSLKDQIACARRELAIRQRVFPKRVLTKQMTQESCDKELAAMTAIIDTLERLERGDEQLAAPPF
jgi:hypothetical protein